MNLQVNLMRKAEQRFQGIVSMKVMALGSVSLLAGITILVFTLVGISKMTLTASLGRARQEFGLINPQADVLRTAQAAIAKNQKTLAELDRWGAAACPPMNVILRSVQTHVPAQMALSHFFAGIERGKESNNAVHYSLRISGVAEGELTAVEAKRQLNADAELRRFCGEIRLASSQRYGETWAFSIEGSRPAEGGK
jgi:hypothetical protein